MKYFKIIILMVCICVPGFAEAEDAAENTLSDKFYISKVNRREKQWVVPSNQRDFMGSHSLWKLNYAKELPPEERGEFYIVTWRYKGESVDTGVKLKFEYKAVNDTTKLRIREKTWPELQRKSYNWIFKHVGETYREEGNIERWKGSIIFNDNVVAVKRSATWREMEGD